MIKSIAPLLFFGLLILIPTLIAGFRAERRYERRRLRRNNLWVRDKNRTRAPDATPEFSQFVRHLAGSDYKDTSLVRPNGKYYGATFANDFLVLRLPLQRHEQALADGGAKTDREEWVGFHYDWGNSVPGRVSQPTIEQWCRVARDYADRA